MDFSFQSVLNRLPSCGSGLFVILILMLVWIGATLKKVPSDLFTLIQNYRDKDWNELKVNGVVSGFYWFSALLCGFFIYAALAMPKQEYG